MAIIIRCISEPGAVNCDLRACVYTCECRRGKRWGRRKGFVTSREVMELQGKRRKLLFGAMGAGIGARIGFGGGLVFIGSLIFNRYVGAG